MVELPLEIIQHIAVIAMFIPGERIDSLLLLSRLHPAFTSFVQRLLFAHPVLTDPTIALLRGRSKGMPA